MEEIIEDFCKKLRCSFIALDLEKLQHARDMLSKLQYRRIFQNLLGPEAVGDDEEPLHPEEHQQRLSQLGKLLAHHAPTDYDADKSSDRDNASAQRLFSGDETERLPEEEELIDAAMAATTAGICSKVVEEQPEDLWHGYFTGYQILYDADVCSGLNDHKKCIELTKSDCDADINAYLRAGIRCFAIDLFSGTDLENQTIIVRLRENEIKVSNEFGFPVSATLFAKLSPRLQYVGLLTPPDAIVQLVPGDELTLTTDRYWSTRGNRRRVYVNARFLIDDVQPFDFLLIGATIQLHVRHVLPPDRLRCVVVVGGDLRSRLPVRFPGRCNKQRISAEELEDITFAKEVGVNIIVSYTAGSRDYYYNLNECLRLLRCDKMRLCARVVLNELRGCADHMNWVAECYDGLLVEFNPRQPQDSCENEALLAPSQAERLHLCPVGVRLLERAYQLQKPIIMDAVAIAHHYLVVAPEHLAHVFYYPDKYIVRCDRSMVSFYFDQLQCAQFAPLAAARLADPLHCDPSHSGSDSLARACVACASELGAAYILVVGHTGRMAIKISHYRPVVPILFVTSMQSAGDFISVYHHVTMLYYRGTVGDEEPYRRAVYKQMLLGLVYGKARKLLRSGQHVILVYQEAEGTKCPDKYVAYKFQEQHFAEHLKRTLFGN